MPEDVRLIRRQRTFVDIAHHGGIGEKADEIVLVPIRVELEHESFGFNATHNKKADAREHRPVLESLSSLLRKSESTSQLIVL